jgi:hypothetical protein
MARDVLILILWLAGIAAAIAIKKDPSLLLGPDSHDLQTAFSILSGGDERGQ